MKIDTKALLKETLELSKDNRGTSVVLDFTDVTGYPERPGDPRIEITGESVQDAALRFRGRKVTVLNFASGVSPGGGVRTGSTAQEEILCLTSGLLHGLDAHEDYYLANQYGVAPRFCHDRMIWSEGVPLFRDGGFKLVEPMGISVITYPAPNLYRGVYADPMGFSEEQESATAAAECFYRRCRHVVRQASQSGAEVLILGAWGCGAYCNDPYTVAKQFKDALRTQSGGIDTVVFAIYGVQGNQDAFREVFGG